MSPLRFPRICRLIVCSLAQILALARLSCLSAQTAVVTYHNDNFRTGWNSSETSFTHASVSSSEFGLLFTVAVDDQVEAQPLIVPDVKITRGTNQGTHDVVYVVTDNDTVYAIDANSGVILLSNHLGTAVPSPIGCRGNGPHLGITSTPVIDPSSGTLYLMAYSRDGTAPVYRLHALDIGSLADKMTPVVVTAAHTLTDGTTFVFDATYQRQRPALLEANGNIYAAFGSFCDLSGSLSRGWVLGWSATTLAPLAANQLMDTQTTSPDDAFLSSIWMSGYGLAADDSGNVLFVTGNSDHSGTTYDGLTNIQESVVKVAPDLSRIVDLFTPSNWQSLDESDIDFGSGGVMVLPDQPGSLPDLAVAAGKIGTLFLMNEDDLGGYSPTQNNVLGSYGIGGCWCGPAFFVDPDGLARVVSSGGKQVAIWKLQTSPKPKLARVIASPVLSTGQNGGFFTSISSNGTADPIVWALSRPLSKSAQNTTLYAFNPDSGGSTMAILFSGRAGSWPNIGGNYNQVPVVANGKVYVASYKQLSVFGLDEDGLRKASKNKEKKKKNH